MKKATGLCLLKQLTSSQKGSGLGFLGHRPHNYASTAMADAVRLHTSSSMMLHLTLEAFHFRILLCLQTF